MAPFYSDAQRKWFFANIAPMEKWGLGELADLASDPIGNAKKWMMYESSTLILDALGKALGIEEVKDEELIKKLEDTIKGSEYRAVLTKDELGNLKKLTSRDVQQKWAGTIAGLIDKNEKVKEYVLDNAEHFLGNALSIVSVIDGGNYDDVRDNGKKHKGTDIQTFRKEDVEYLAPYDGIVTKADWNDKLGNYAEILFCEEPGKFFVLTGGHMSDYNVEEGRAIREGDSVGTIGNTGSESRGIHLDVKRMNLIFDCKEVDDKEFKVEVKLSEEDKKNLENTNLYKNKKLIYENGAMILKGNLRNSDELEHICSTSKRLNSAIQTLKNMPDDYTDKALKKLKKEEVWDIIQGKNQSWSIKRSEYKDPKKSADKIMDMIKHTEKRKRSSEIIDKISKSAAKEFATWILASKVDRSKKEKK